MDSVYQEIQNILPDIDDTIDQGQEVIQKLSKNENICDFSSCSPSVINNSPTIGINVSAFGVHLYNWDACLPICKTKECVGNPCPGLGEELELITASFESANAVYNDTYELFNKKTEIVTNEIREKGETASSSKITKFEFAKRELQLSRNWLTSGGYEQEKSCMLTSIEEKKAAAGQFDSPFLMKCFDATMEGIYWPKPWSETCANECVDGATPDCISCLSANPGEAGSVLAKINYKIYGTCATECQDQSSAECYNCLCPPEWSDSECQAWFCGGNSLNWVCCH